MKILYLSNAAARHLTGSDRNLLALAAFGRSEGHSVVVGAPGRSALHEACAETGLSHVEVSFHPTPGTLRKLKKVITGQSPNLIHAMSIAPVTAARLSGATKSRGHMGLVASVLVDPSSSLPLARKRLKRAAVVARNIVARKEAERIDRILVATRTIQGQLKELHIGGNQTVIPCAIDTRSVVEKSRMPFDAPSGRPRIGSAVGQLETLKGVEFLIKAFAQISEKYPQATLTIAGEGSQRGALERLADELGVSNRVIFAGFLDPVAPFMASLDLYVLPSLSEGLNGSVLEAMALGLPVISTDVGGMHEVVHDQETGLLVPAANHPELAEAIDRLLADPKLAGRLARQGKAYVDQHYSYQEMCQSTYDEYYSVMRDHPRPRQRKTKAGL